MFALSVCLVASALLTWKTSTGAPNIIYFLADDAGWNDVSWQNASDVQTPVMADLVKEGLILHKFYVQPYCTPTRCAFMTGRYPIRYGMQMETISPDQPYGLPLTETLLPEELKAAGYDTYLVGKWHLGFYQWDFTPTYRGFDSFYGYFNDGISKWTHQKRYRKGPGNWLLGYDFRDDEANITGDGEYVTDLFTDRALEIIENQHEDDPFFMWMSFSNPHSPVDPHPDFVEMYDDSGIVNQTRIDYNAMVSHVDFAIGQMVDKLIEKGIWENTLIVFSSDNGPAVYNVHSSGYPLRGAKSTLFEGAVRVPAFIAGGYLNSSRHGQTYENYVHMTDWLPTFVSLAGGTPTSDELDGFDLSDLILKGSGTPDGDVRDEILINDDSANPRCNNSVTISSRSFTGPLCGALISGNFKLVIGYQASDVDLPEYNGWLERPDQSHLSNPNPSVDCGQQIPSWNDARYDCPFQDPDVGCLYNLNTDPCEISDVREDSPGKYTKMLGALYDFSSAAASPLKAETDPTPAQANPDNFASSENATGWWTPWQ